MLEQWLIFLMLVPGVFVEGNECDVELYIDPSENEFTISSPGYPETYPPGIHQTYCLSTENNVTLTLFCDDIDIPKSADCEMNALVIPTSEGKTRSYCGTKSFRVTSSSNEMTVKLLSSKKFRGGKFSCRIKINKQEQYSVRAIVYENCDCGSAYRPRIVGGEETQINEFPFMAGVVDNRRGAIVLCGCTIISARYVVTACHCLDTLVVEQTAVLVGEHNITTGLETTATVLIRARRFVPYPYYDSQRRQYDIALIEVLSDIPFSMRVGPCCLPFVSRDWDLTGERCTVLGWGTTEFGGRRSKVLQKAELFLQPINDCINAYGSDIEPYTQYCAFAQGKDACQYDSGGPLVWFNSYINRYEIVATVGYGRGCASDIPSVNTKCAPFLQWILDNTQSETYCYKQIQ